ncbi:MAG: nicotinamide-nucleotide amidohydrolase family protein [Deltaproteobacteria bacterium]|nr:nicotinamide-nucleotide amidohydrolase family protein [Deltaproteobacteria bacterium]
MLAKRVGEALGRPGYTLAAAESCTGGLFSAAVTDIPGSSAYFPGGFVAYSNASKTRDLGVSKSLIESAGAVSENVALAMAEGVKRRFRSAVAVGITGIAGPGGGTPEKPVGTVCLGISAGKVRRSYRRRFSGGRQTVRRKTVAWAFEELLAVLQEIREGGK